MSAGSFKSVHCPSHREYYYSTVKWLENSSDQHHVSILGGVHRKEVFIRKELTVCWFLRRGGNCSTWRKTFQIMQRRVLTAKSYPNDVVDARIQTWSTLVGCECSDLCTRQPASPNHFSRSLPCYRITLYHFIWIHKMGKMKWNLHSDWLPDLARSGYPALVSYAWSITHMYSMS